MNNNYSEELKKFLKPIGLDYDLEFECRKQDNEYIIDIMKNNKSVRTERIPDSLVYKAIIEGLPEDKSELIKIIVRPGAK